VEDIRSGFGGAEDFATEVFEMPSYVVPHRQQRHLIKFCAEWGIDEDELGLMYDVKEDRVVFPVRHEGHIVDATGRTLGKRLPKWKRYGKSGLPYSHGCGKVAVVVEDCVSAAVVGSDVRLVGVAMLGTSMLESHKRYLSQFSTAVIALDPDALPKTLAIAKELRGHVSDVRVLRLTDDIKYRHPDDMDALASLTDKEIM
jgi:DNA primase